MVETTGYLECEDGAHLYFEDTGGDGPCLLFLYGLGCSIAHWKYPRQHLKNRAPKLRQVWFDLRGHGKSPLTMGDKPLTLEVLLSDLTHLCSELKLTDVHVLGQSFGGSIALKFAAMRPDLVKSVVGLAAPGRNPMDDEPLGKLPTLSFKFLTRLNRIARPAIKQVYQGLPLLAPLLIEIIRHRGFNPKLAKTEDIAEYVDHLVRNDPNLFYDLAHELTDFNVSKFAADIKAPVLLIAGAQDQIVTLDHSKWLLKQLPTAELDFIKHGSHCPHMDDPGTVNRRIAKFYEKIGLLAGDNAKRSSAGNSG
jgi:pimeloyl-ACP methyl ester carboxylesterase